MNVTRNLADTHTHTHSVLKYRNTHPTNVIAAFVTKDNN